MRRFLALLLLAAMLLAVREIGRATGIGGVADDTMVLGFVLLASYIVGELAARIQLPRITGYLVAGVLFGPFLLPQLSVRLELLSPESLERLSFIDSIALGLIAFSAGGELKVETVRRAWKAVLWVTVFKVIVVLAGVGLALVALSGMLPILSSLEMQAVIAVSILFATIAVAKSPATTIAVINEYRPKGRLTDITLGVTVIKDVVVVILFALALPTAKVLLEPTQSFDIHFLFEQLLEIVGSLAIGLVLGWALALYIARIGKELGLVVLATAFLAIFIADSVHLSGLLICMVAGFIVQNSSRQGDLLHGAVEEHSLPVYIVFFTLAGAALDLGALALHWKLALVLVALRLFFTAVGCFLGAAVAGESRSVKLYGWMGFLGQAGLSLSFARKIAEDIPDVGQSLYAVLLAAVALNQLIGPALFRFGLARSGEIPEAPTRRGTERRKS